VCQLATAPAPQAVATDRQGDVWVSETLPAAHVGENEVGKLYEFGPVEGGSCGGFLGPKAGPAPLEVEVPFALNSMAIEPFNGWFYLTGNGPFSENPVDVFDVTGKRVESWKNVNAFFLPSNHGPVGVAVDSSTEAGDPSRCGSPPLVAGECFVYVIHGQDPGAPYGDGLPPGIEKLNGKGEAEPFSAAGSVAYVSGNEITGTPGGAFSLGELGAVTVDRAGDIFAGNGGVVDEWEASGRFVRSFSLALAPGLGVEEGSGEAVGLAVDGVSGHLLVAAKDNTPHSAVDEFDIGSGEFLDQVSEAGPGVGLVELSSLATDASGDVFAVDERTHRVVVFAAGHFAPNVALTEASGRTPAGATLNGSVNPLSLENPEHGGVTACHFQLVTEATFRHNVETHGGREGEGFAELGVGGGEPECVPGPAGIVANDSVQPVHAVVSGLTPGVTYRYRLVATTDPAKKGGTAETSSLAFTAPRRPEVLSASAGNVSSAFADLEASIDPLGASTSYRFEYLTAAGFAANGGSFSGPDVPVSVPVPAAGIGSGGPTGSSQERVVQPLAGLSPATVYDFRVVAENECEAVARPGAQCVTEGAAQTFATLAAPEPGLPDGRAYELVTPVDKGGGSDMFGQPLTNEEYSNEDDGTPSASGNGLLLETKAAFGPFPGAGSSAYVFSRDAENGWGFVSLAAPALGVQNLIHALFDPVDLSSVAVSDGVGAAAGPGGEAITSVVGPPGGPYTTVHADAPRSLKEIDEGLQSTQVVGGSRDLSHVVFESPSGSACRGAEETSQLGHGDVLCEWDGGEPKLVNVNEEGTLLNTCGAVLGTRLQAGGMGSSRGTQTVVGSTYGAVSADGSKVFFTAPAPNAENAGPGCWKPGEEEKKSEPVNPPQLYMRAGGQTVTLSAPEPEVREEVAGKLVSPRAYPVAYVGASEDGSRVFFVTEAWLTSNHPKGHDMELYEYDTGTRALMRISAGEAAVNPGAAGGAEVQAVTAVATEGRAVYFTAFAALAGAAKRPDPKGEEVNLYRYDTESGAITYVATVNTGDDESRAECFANTELRVHAPCPDESWYTTPDGRYLLFSSTRELTGYSTVSSGHPGCPLTRNGTYHNGHCQELYRYDAAAGSLSCISCNPSGAQPGSNASFTRSAPAGLASGPVHALSDDGAYAFFDSADSLVPTAQNHTLDVYEWHEGRISLLSSPSDAYPSFFLGYSPYETPHGRKIEGGNVFIGTHANLLPSQDTESEGNIYDARICRPEEEAPCIQPPPGETAQCLGTACQNPPPPPTDATPASLTFTGPGDLVSELPAPPAAARRKATVKCRKPGKLTRGRCVKPRRSTRAKRPAHHNPRGR